MFFMTDFVEVVHRRRRWSTTLFFGGWQVPVPRPRRLPLPVAAPTLALPSLVVALLQIVVVHA